MRLDSGVLHRKFTAILTVIAAAVWFAVVWRNYLPAGLVELDGFDLPRSLRLNAWWIDLALAAIIAFAAHGIGARVIDRLSPATQGAERVLLSTSLGITALILAASAFALVGLFRPTPLRLLAGLLVLCGVGFSLRTGRRPVSVGAGQPEAYATTAIAALFFLCALVLAAMPETSPDGLQFHLLYPQYFLERGTFYLADHYRSNIPLYAHVLYSMGIAVHGFGLSRFLQFLFLPGIALCTYALAYRMPLPDARRAPAATLAVAALVSSPVVLLYSTRSYPDLPVAFFESVAIYCAIHGQGRAGPVLAGLFAGMAAGTKYAGLYGIPLVAALCFAGAWRQGRRAAVVAAMLAASVAAAVASPWYLRNFINTGDPLYPALYRHIEKPLIDPVEAGNLMRDARNPDRAAMTPGNIARLPWLLTMQGNRFAGSLGPLFLWMLPLIALAATRQHIWLAALSTALALSMLWMLGPQWLRYYLPVLPCLAALGAHSIYRIERRSPRLVALAAALVLVLVNLPPWRDSWISGGIHAAREIPFDVAFGPRAPADYQRQYVRGFTAAERLNAGLLPPDARILPVYSSELPRALLRRQVLDVFDAHRIVCRDAAGNWTACYRVGTGDMRRGMDAAGVTALAIRRETRDLTATGALTLEDPFLRTDFRFLEFAGDTYLFERRRGGRVIGEHYLQYDLLARLATHTDVDVSADHLVTLTMQGPRGVEMRPAMIVLPGAEVRFTLQLGREPQLVFSLGMERAAARKAGGATVEVLAGPEQELLFSRAFRPEDAPGGWHNATIDLRLFSDREIVVTFRTRGAADWIGIAEPVIYARDAGEPIPTMPWMVSFDRQSLAAPVDVQFDPPRIRPGEYYTVSIPALSGAEIDIMASYTGKPPDTVLRWTRLDAHGRSRLFVPPMAPGMMQVHAVRRSGERRWLAASGAIELLPPR